MASKAPLHQTVHVEGRTPGSPGLAPMVTVANGVPSPPIISGSHHEAVYLAAIEEMARMLQQGVTHLVVTSPSEHLVEQMRRKWKVGPELDPLHRLAVLLEGMFTKVDWDLAPRT